MNTDTPAANRLPLQIPASLSQSSRRGTRPNCCSRSHMPSSRSSVLRVGIIRPRVNLECAHVITRVDSNRAVPSSNGILNGGNHRSHCAASPGDHTIRSAGSTFR